jgi:hypothetical protein
MVEFEKKTEKKRLEFWKMSVLRDKTTFNTSTPNKQDKKKLFNSPCLSPILKRVEKEIDNDAFANLLAAIPKNKPQKTCPRRLNRTFILSNSLSNISDRSNPGIIRIRFF